MDFQTEKRQAKKVGRTASIEAESSGLMSVDVT